MTVTDLGARRERVAREAAQASTAMVFRRNPARVRELVEVLWQVEDLADRLATVDVEDACRAVVEDCGEAAHLLEDLQRIVLGRADDGA